MNIEEQRKRMYEDTVSAFTSAREAGGVPDDSPYCEAVFTIQMTAADKPVQYGYSFASERADGQPAELPNGTLGEVMSYIAGIMFEASKKFMEKEKEDAQLEVPPTDMPR